MNLKDITCKCPRCGEAFALGDALEEQAVEQVRAELAALNDDDVEVRIEKEKARALSEGKKLAAEETLAQATKKQKELDDARTKVNVLELAQVEKDSEITKLRNQQETAITLKLAEQKSQLDAEKTSAETALKLKIQQSQRTSVQLSPTIVP